MTTETKTIKMGISPGIARYIENLINSIPLPDNGPLAVLIGRKRDDTEERMANLTNWMVTYLIAKHLLSQGLEDEDVTDYAISIVKRENDA